MSFGRMSCLPVFTTVLPLGKPSLAFNFLTGPLDSRFTFTRASTATHINSAGAITLAAINEPRFDYDPVTLSPRGLLLEEQRTNTVLNSAAPSTQAITFGATTCTLSFYGTGTIVLSGTHSATVVGLGAYPSRKTYTFTPTAGNLILTITGTVQNAQLEAGLFATSWIPTTGTIVTRSADFAIMDGTNFSSWFNPSAGTLFSQFDVLSASTGSAAMAMVAADSGDRDGYALIKSASSTKVVATAGEDSAVLGNIVSNIPVKAAVAYDGVNNAGVVDGGAVSVISSSGGEVTEPLQLTLGHNLTNQNAGSGHIRQVAFYPRRMTNAELQALTA